jgi:hypothetical protein
MGAGVWLASAAMGELVSQGTLVGQTLQVGVPVGVGVVLYLGLAVLFKVEELDMIKGIVGRRFKR